VCTHAERLVIRMGHDGHQHVHVAYLCAGVSRGSRVAGWGRRWAAGTAPGQDPQGSLTIVRQSGSWCQRPVGGNADRGSAHRRALSSRRAEALAPFGKGQAVVPSGAWNSVFVTQGPSLTLGATSLQQGAFPDTTWPSQGSALGAKPCRRNSLLQPAQAGFVVLAPGLGLRLPCGGMARPAWARPPSAAPWLTQDMTLTPCSPLVLDTPPLPCYRGAPHRPEAGDRP